MPELETDPLKMAAIMLGLRDVNVLGIEEDDEGLVIELERTSPLPECSRCGEELVVGGIELREVPGQPSFGRPTKMIWRLRRFRCETPGCPAAEWTEDVPPQSARDDARQQ